MKLLVIKHPKGCYIRNEDNYSDNISNLIVNGKPLSKTWDKYWYSVDDEPKTVQTWQKQPAINHRYVLKDMSFASDKIKAEYPREEVANYVDYSWEWKPEYATYRSLYEEKSDQPPDILVDVPFEVAVIFEVDHEAPEPFGFAYPVMKTQWKSDGLKDIKNDELRHRILDEIQIPSLYLPERPCKLTSKQTYQIIRQFVKDNIDPKVASVTSDYEFCFTVKKIVPRAVPRKYTVDINNDIFAKRKKKPILEERVEKTVAHTVFEMTSDEDKYKGYPIIPGVEGKDDADLKARLDAFLADLIEFINEPLCECEHCKGTGYLFDRDKFERNLQNDC